MSNDGESIDWDKEASALVSRGKGAENEYYKTMKKISPPDLVSEFAQTAPPDVQTAIRATIGQMLGNMPPEVAESAVTTTGRNLGSLMFSMQITGYMFRNAEYRKSLAASLEASGRSSLTMGEPSTAALPPVSGKLRVKVAEGMEAEVDAAAYMAELRREVEGLRTELVQAREKQQTEKGGGLITFIQQLKPSEAQSLTSNVSQEVLEAMSQLVSSLLIDMDIPYDDAVAVTASYLRSARTIERCPCRRDPLLPCP